MTDFDQAALIVWLGGWMLAGIYIAYQRYGNKPSPTWQKVIIDGICIAFTISGFYAFGVFFALGILLLLDRN